jgi:hypothetical protein
MIVTIYNEYNPCQYNLIWIFQLHDFQWINLFLGIPSHDYKVADKIEGNSMKVDNICILSCVDFAAETNDNQLLDFTPKSCRTILWTSYDLKDKQDKTNK